MTQRFRDKFFQNPKGLEPVETPGQEDWKSFLTGIERDRYNLLGMKLGVQTNAEELKKTNPEAYNEQIALRFAAYCGTAGMMLGAAALYGILGGPAVGLTIFGLMVGIGGATYVAEAALNATQTGREALSNFKDLIESPERAERRAKHTAERQDLRQAAEARMPPKSSISTLGT